MSLSCECAFDFDDWYWELEEDYGFEPLKTKRSRKCCSCKNKIAAGKECIKILRFRKPSERRNWIEESIYGEKVPLAAWYLCEACGGLLMAIEELGFCCTLGDQSLKSQIAEFNDAINIQTITA